MIKKLMITVAVIILLVSNLLMLTGCKKDRGLEIGFTYLDNDVVEDGIFVAVKSEKSIFDLNNVTLDLYYGTQVSEIPVESDERYNPICIAVYYRLRGGGSETLFDDYKNSGRYQIIREISLDDFYGGDYVVTSEPSNSFFGEFSQRKYTYTHSEKFTLPKEHFTEVPIRFYIYVSVVFFDNDESKYYFSEYNYAANKTSISLDIGYELLENDKVQLYDNYIN